MKKIDRAAAYRFLDQFLEHGSDDAESLLKDLVVNYWFFPNGDGSEYEQLSDMEKRVAELMAQGQKIQAIKLVRDQTHWGLKEAKEWVEARIWPNGGTETQYVAELRQKRLKETLEKIATDYGIADLFR